MAEPGFAVRYDSKPRTCHDMILVRNFINTFHGCYLADVQHRARKILSTILSIQLFTWIFFHLHTKAIQLTIKGFILHNSVLHKFNSVICQLVLLNWIYLVNNEKPFLLTQFSSMVNRMLLPLSYICLSNAVVLNICSYFLLYKNKFLSSKTNKPAFP